MTSLVTAGCISRETALKAIAACYDIEYVEEQAWFRQLLMTLHEIEMDDDLAEVQPAPSREATADEHQDEVAEEIAKLRGEFQSRLVVANLRTEAVRAGMVDLDGLKLIDLSAVRLGNDDNCDRRPKADGRSQAEQAVVVWRNVLIKCRHCARITTGSARRRRWK